MNANPLPAAEFLPAAPGTVPPGAGGAVTEPGDPLHAADPRGAADFAALLQSAGLAAEAPAAEQSPELRNEPAPDEAPTTATPESALDGLLFLATVNAATVPIATPGIQADAQPAGISTRAGLAAGAARAAPAAPALVEVPLGDPGTAVAPTAPLDPSLPGPNIATPLGGIARTPTLDAAATDPLVTAALPYARPGSRADPEPEPATALILASWSDAAKRPALDTLARESTAPAAASSVEPAPSPAPFLGATPPSPASVEIDPPVHDPAWRMEAAGRIASLVTRGVEHAELRITPPELGPVELRIDVRGGEATLAIVATHATTRDALEQALPLLREMLAQQGLSLGQASVHDGRGDSPPSGEHPASREAPLGDARAETTGADAPAPRSGRVHRLIDVFA